MAGEAPDWTTRGSHVFYPPPHSLCCLACLCGGVGKKMGERLLYSVSEKLMCGENKPSVRCTLRAHSECPVLIG